jgi:AcrR family transcriptional regulator
MVDTRAGERSPGQILQAATIVLTRDGYGGATLSRIAEEAGLRELDVLDFYESRDALLARVVQTVGEELARLLRAAVTPPQSPRSQSPRYLADAVVYATWSGVTAAPELASAYFALVGSDDKALTGVEHALEKLKQALRAAIASQLAAVDPSRWTLRSDPDVAAGYLLIYLRGLLLEWTETGESATMLAGLERLSDTIAAEYTPRHSHDTR